MSVTVAGPLNSAPVASDDSYSLHAGTVLSIAAAGVLANDSDPDGDALSVTAHDAAANGVLSIAADGGLTYTPDASFVGIEIVSYTVSDGALTDTGQITINVTNTAPGFDASGPFVIDENLTDVGSVAASDPDGDALTYAIAGGADGALFSIDPTTGALGFDAAPDFEAPADADGNNVYELMVSATDPFGAAATAAVQVTVNDVDESTGPNLIIGTPGVDDLQGTEGADRIEARGGPFDFLTGNGGPDTFVLSTAEGNGRETNWITDYTPGEDSIDLGGASVASAFSFNGTTYLYLNYSEFDMVIVSGANALGDIDFV